jgi:hypothetical protein
LVWLPVLVDDSSLDSAAHLQRQRALLSERIVRLLSMVAAVDRELQAQHMGIRLTPEEKLEIFGADFKDEEYAEEAMDAAEAHRQLISQWFYDCPSAMHRAWGRCTLRTRDSPRITKRWPTAWSSTSTPPFTPTLTANPSSSMAALRVVG